MNIQSPDKKSSHKQNIFFNVETIENILKQAKKEHWPYPKTFEHLKLAGVESYEVLIENYVASYKGHGQTWIEPADSLFKPIQASHIFNLKDVKTALSRTQNKQSTYQEFLIEMAKAGIIGYTVHMETRIVKYFGKNPDNFLEEKVPTLG